MRSVGAKVTDEVYDALRVYCEQRRISINECLAGLIQDLLAGKIKFKGTGLANNVLFCPECGFLLFPNFKEGTFNCIRCGFYAKVPPPEEWREGEPINLK